MNHHINSIGYACQKYVKDANLVQALFQSSGGRCMATDMAVEKLKEQNEHLHSICDNAEGFIDMMKALVWEQEVAHHVDALDPNAARPVSVRPAYSQPREYMFQQQNMYMFQQQNMWQKDMESDARYDGAGDESEERGTATSKIWAEHDCNTPVNKKERILAKVH